MIINLPKLGPVQFRDDLTPEQFQAQLKLLQQKYDFKLPKPEAGLMSLAGRGFMRGLGETGIAFGDTLPAMAASALGFEDYAKRQLAEAEASREELQRKYPAQFESYKEPSSIYEGLQYGAETLGELGPSALTALIPGVGFGAAGSRLAGASALRAAQAAGPVSRAGLAGVEKAAQVGGRRAMYGGVYLGSLSQNAPEIFENIYRETDKMEPGIAALAGGISSVLDTVVPGNLLDNLGKYGRLKVAAEVAKNTGAAPKVWKYIAAEAGKSAVAEGLTETAQEAISATAERIAGSTKEVFAPENFDRYAESFIKGAIGGGAFGVVGGTGKGISAKREYRDLKEIDERLKSFQTGSAFDTLSQETDDVGEVVTPPSGAGAGVAGVPPAGAAAPGVGGTPPTGLAGTGTTAATTAGRKGPQRAPVDTSKMTDAELAAYEAAEERRAIQEESGVLPEDEATTGTPPSMGDQLRGQQRAMLNFEDFKDQYQSIRSDLTRLMGVTSPSAGQVDMMQRLGAALNELVDTNAAGIARNTSDPDLIQNLKNPAYDGTKELDRIGAKVGVPRAAPMQPNMFGTPESAFRRANDALTRRNNDPVAAAEMLNEERARVLQRFEAGEFDANWAISTHRGMPAGKAAKDFQTLAEQHVQRTLGSIDAALDIVRRGKPGTPRASQMGLFEDEGSDARIDQLAQMLEARRQEREQRKEALPPTQVGEALKEADVLPEDFAEKPTIPERQGVMPTEEKAEAPDVSTEHVAKTDEGRVLAGFFDLLQPSSTTEAEQEKHQSAKNVAAEQFLEFDISEPGATTSPGARRALNYLASLVGGADRLRELMGRLEGKSPETQAEILRSYGLPDLTTRRGMEAFSQRVQSYFKEVNAPEDGGAVISTREGRMPATGEFKGKIPYSEEVPVVTKAVSAPPPLRDSKRPRRPEMTTKEKLYNLNVHGLRGAVRFIRQLIESGGKPSPEQAAAKAYLDSKYRSTFGQALNDLAFDLAYFELDPRNHGTNSTFFGEGGENARRFKAWIEQNLDAETNSILNEMVEDYKRNYAAEKALSREVSAYNERIKQYNDERLDEVEERTGVRQRRTRTPTEKREPSIIREQMLVEIHPALVRMLANGDVNGALQILAQGKSITSVLAQRLLDAGLTAKSSLIRADEVIPLSGDPDIKTLLKDQASVMMEAVRAFVPKEMHATLERQLSSDNLIELNDAINVLENQLANANEAQREIFRMFKDLFTSEFMWAGKYDPRTDEIVLRRGMGNLTNLTFLHEGLHAATLHLIDNADSLQGIQRRAYDELNKLFETAKGALAQEELRRGKIYGLKDLHEFISEAFTNPVFQAQLRAIAYKSTQASLWNRFTEAIGKLFGVKPGQKESNVLVEVMRATDAFIAAPARLDNMTFAEPTSRESKERFKEEQGFYETRRTLSEEERLAEEAKRRAELRQKPSEPRAARAASRRGPPPQGMPTQKSDIKRLMTSQNWSEVKQELPRLLRSMRASARPYLLGMLTLQQINDLVANRIPQIGNFLRVRDEFLARKNSMLKEAGDIAERWQRLQARDPEMSVNIGKVMHTATLAEVDPDKATTKQRNEQADLMNQWRALSPEAKEIYREVRDFYDRRFKEYKRLMNRRIIEMRQMGVSGYEAAKMIAHLNGVPQGVLSQLDTYNASESTINALLRSGFTKQVEQDLRKGGADGNTILEIRDQFERSKLRGPYFPLMRYGRFWYQIGTGATREYYMFDTQGQLEVHLNNRLAKNPELNGTQITGSTYAEQGNLQARESSFLKAAFQAIDDTSMTGLDQQSADNRKQNIKDNLYQVYLANQPEHSFRRRFMERQGIEGFSQDALRNFPAVTFHMAYQLARFEYSPELFSQIDAARAQLKNRVTPSNRYNPELMQENFLLSDYVTEVDRRLELMLNPTDVGVIPSLMSNIGFIWYLTSVASAAVNVLGGAIIGVPTLVGHYVRLHPGASYTKALTEVLKQMKTVVGQVMSSGFAVETGDPLPSGPRGFKQTMKDIGTKTKEFRLHLPSLDRSGTMTPLEKAAYDRLVADGLIDITQTYDLSGLAATPTEQYGGVGHRAMTLLAYLFHNAERFNREMVAMSAFRTAMEQRSGMKDKQRAFTESIAEAKDVTTRAMFDYSSTNKPRYFQHPVARVVLQFKQFPQQMTFFLTKSLMDSLKGASPEIKREARARFVGTMGMTAVMAGTTGLWGYSVLSGIVNAVVNGLSDDDEEPFDFDLAYMQWATDTFGKQLGTLLTRGVGNAMGVDLASRLKLDEMWFREGRQNQDEEEALKSFLVDLLGPTVGLLPMTARAVSLWNQGQGDRALEAIAPGFIKQPLIAARYAKEGVMTLKGEQMVDDVGALSLFLQSLGLRPAEVAELQLYNIRVKGQEQKILKKRQDLLNLYGIAFIANDGDTLDAALDKIDEFNMKFPSVQIPMDSLSRTVKERLEKSTETDHGLYIDKRLRDSLDRYTYARS